MKPIIDLNKEYGLVFDGGGARGAYQIGAWRALSEAGVKISAVAGTSVGALNGALVCMGDLEKAGHIWKEMAFSRVMDVDDELMEQFFDGEASIREILKGLWKKLADGGIDITPLKELIHEVVDEEKIRKCGKEFCLLTFSVSDMKELDLSIEDIPEGLLEDFLLASAYLLGFKNEPLHGKTYIDGGAVNNVPTASLLKRGYKDLIQVRIFGPGRVPKTTIPEDGSLLEIEPRVGLGSILEFSAKRSRQNLKIGYYDAKRALYGLTGSIYYIEETREECYYVEIMKLLSELEKTEYRFKLKLPIGCSDRELFYGMLEASAKLMRIPKYNIYTADELWNETSRKYETRPDEEKEKLPSNSTVLFLVPYFNYLSMSISTVAVMVSSTSSTIAPIFSLPISSCRLMLFSSFVISFNISPFSNGLFSFSFAKSSCFCVAPNSSFVCASSVSMPATAFSTLLTVPTGLSETSSV